MSHWVRNFKIQNVYSNSVYTQVLRLDASSRCIHKFSVYTQVPLAYTSSPCIQKYYDIICIEEILLFRLKDEWFFLFTSISWFLQGFLDFRIWDFCSEQLRNGLIWNLFSIDLFGIDLFSIDLFGVEILTATPKEIAKVHVFPFSENVPHIPHM